MRIGFDAISGAVFALLAAGCSAGAIVARRDHPERAFYLLAESAALMLAALARFGVFN